MDARIENAHREDAWLKAAIDYAGRWIGFKMNQLGQPGCVFAVTHRGQLVHEQAFGVADLVTGEALTPRHRFRVASHSKTFTATGIFKLVEQGRLSLDSTAGSFVDGLHPDVAAVTLRQLLSHGAGLTRDGDNAGFFGDVRPFLNKDELLAELKKPLAIRAGQRFKYSNYGYSLLGLIIEAITGEAYADWTKREVVAAAGLSETYPDMPSDAGFPFARGHTARLLSPTRLVIPGENPGNAMASATGFVSTAADLARFMAQLSPDAEHSVLSVASRREMIAQAWNDPASGVVRNYSLGVYGSKPSGIDNFGHIGAFQGTITRTAMLPAHGVSLSVLTNAIDGPAVLWMEALIRIVQRFHQAGAPPATHADWTGRWWGLWGAIELVALGDKVVAFNPAFDLPFAEASEITLSDADNGMVTSAPGFDRFGEPVHRARDDSGMVTRVQIGGAGFVSEEIAKAQMQKRYGVRAAAE